MFILTVSLFYPSRVILATQNQPIKQNLAIIDSLFGISINEIVEKISLIKDFEKDTISYYISENEADWLVQKHLVNNLSKSILKNNKSEKRNFIGITIENIELNYNFIDKNNDSVVRTASLKLFVSVYDRESRTFTFETGKSLEDTLSYTQLELANRSSFEFAKTEIPKKKLSFWNKYLEPTIAVVSAAIVTTLFFTVRSQ